MEKSHRLFIFGGFVVVIMSLYMLVQEPWHLRVSGQGEQGWAVYIPQIERGDSAGDNSTIPRATPSPIPTATPLPLSSATPLPTPSPTGDGDEHNHAHEPADLYWHPPGSHGDRPPHEHGDPPPQWVLDAGYEPSFTHVANTAGENHAYWKHTGFKGYAGNFHNVDWYGIFHLDFNPGGHVSRFHSYQIWFRDAADNVSHMHGWMDFGESNNTGPNFVGSCTKNDVRPIVAVIEQGCDVQANFESWYGNFANRTEAWGPDFGFNIAANYYAGGDPNDPTSWVPIDENVRNLTRRIEFAWYAFRSDLRGEFWTTQWGDIVDGPNDSRCETDRAYGERTYTIVCLRQYIAPTLTTIDFPGNSVQRTFDGKGIVKLPN